jgi:imidazole glycerol-phosphate synthase subunit HisH
MILIIDYGMGNLRSVEKAFHKLGFAAEVSGDPAALTRAQGMVLPGVGAFADCMKNLQKLGLIEPVTKWIQADRPFLGICLGFQVLFEESEEFGPTKGLGIFSGKVIKFSDTMPDPATKGGHLKVPHMGWNTIELAQPTPALEGLQPASSFYFVHSYYPEPADNSLVATWTEYGVRFASSIAAGNLFASQFHPEKSQANGLRLLKNFGELVNRRG